MQENVRDFSLLKGRILQYLEYKHLSKYDVYHKTGISNGILSQKNGLSEDNLLKILSYYNDLNPTWLITGNGNMILNSETSIAENSSTGPLSVQKEDFSWIPFYGETGTFDENSPTLNPGNKWHQIPVFKNADFLITVRGDSMLPNYKPGDIVACKKLGKDFDFQWNRVYALNTETGIMIKRIHPGNEKNSLSIISDNPEFGSFELNIKKIQNFALVLGSIRPE